MGTAKQNQTALKEGKLFSIIVAGLFSSMHVTSFFFPRVVHSKNFFDSWVKVDS